MKKLILILALLMAIPAFADGPIVIDGTKDTLLDTLAGCEKFAWGTNGTYASKVWEATMTVGDGNGDYTIIDTANGRGLQIEAQSETASGSATCDTWMLYDTDTTTVFAYGTLNSLSVSSGANYNFATATVVEVYDAQ